MCGTIGRTNTTADKVNQAGEILFLHLYRTKAEIVIPDALHYTQIQKCLKRNSPKLESIPLLLIVLPNIYLGSTIKLYISLEIKLDRKIAWK